MDTNENGLKTLAQDRFGRLSSSETALLAAVATGTIASLDRTAPGQVPDPSASEIRGTVIRWLCTDRLAKSYVDPFGIRLEGATITDVRHLDLSSAVLPFPLVLSRCHLPFTLCLSGADVSFISIEDTFVQALEAYVCRVRGDLYLRAGFWSDGIIRIAGSTIGGDVDLTNARLSGPAFHTGDVSGGVLDGRGISVSGDVLLRDGFYINGGVDLTGASIAGDLDCRKGRFNTRLQGTGTGLPALNIERASIKGDVILEGAEVLGEVRMRNLHLQSDIVCDNGVFVGLPTQEQAADESAPGKSRRIALNAEGAHIEGNVQFRKQSTVYGDVEFVSARIDGQMEYNGAKFVGLVQINSSVIANVLFWRSIRKPQAVRLDLMNTTVGAFINESNSWPRTGNLEIVGFKYGDIQYGEGSKPDWLDWLRLQKKYSVHYPQPFRQLAKARREAGHDSHARRVLYTMECERHNNERQALRRTDPTQDWRQYLEKVWPAIKFAVFSVPKRVTGHGYYPERALAWLSALIVSTGIIYGGANRRGLMVPTESAAFDALSTNHRLPDAYVPFHSFAYALESSFQLLKLGQIDRWQPRGNATWLWIVHWWQVGLGWFLAAIFVAAVTGLIRKE